MAVDRSKESEKEERRRGSDAQISLRILAERAEANLFLEKTHLAKKTDNFRKSRFLLRAICFKFSRAFKSLEVSCGLEGESEILLSMARRRGSEKCRQMLSMNVSLVLQ